MESVQVLVIGAGMAGLTFAQSLKQQGYDVACVDKARGSGGRLSSKRVKTSELDLSFDLGASSFNANTNQFKQAINQWHQQGVVSTWLQQEDEPEYVGVPRNSSVTRHLADEVGVSFGVRITSIAKDKKLWRVFREIEQGEELFAIAEHIVFATPAEQTYGLLPSDNPLTPLIKDVKIFPQWVLMIAVPQPLSLPNNILSPTENIQRITYENSKPKRQNASGLHVYCIQASAEWSGQRLEYSKDKISFELTSELATLCPEPILVKSDYVHRWLYSQGSCNGHVDAGFLTSNDGIHICGDYLLSELNVCGIEAAFLSGKALSGFIANTLKASERAG